MLVSPSRLMGSALPPPSKSHTQRALVFAAMARGKSIIYSPLDSPDIHAMVKGLKTLGKSVIWEDETIVVEGDSPIIPKDTIDAGNSGLVLRFLGALGALAPYYTVITGDESIRSRRKVAPLLDGLRQWGAFAETIAANSYAPIIVKGPLTERIATIDGEDSQPVSALLMTAAFSKGNRILKVNNPGEKPWVLMTLDWFDKLGIKYTKRGFEEYHITGPASYDGFIYTVPRDFSSASYLLGAAITTESRITIEGLDFCDSFQGDAKIFSLLQKWGAKIEKLQSRVIINGGTLLGEKIEINDIIDALPLFAVLACFAKNETEIVNGRVARYKESDRISAIAAELRKMGAKIEEKEEGLKIWPSCLKGACVHSHSDHRIALSLAVAALGAEGETVIENSVCIEKSYPEFVQTIKSLGGNIATDTVRI